MDTRFSAADRQSAIDRLHAEGCSCVVLNGREMHIFRERGVKDLFRLLHEDPALLDGAFVADKVVGKGAAALMILGGVDSVFADTMSTPAAGLFRAAGITAECTTEVPHIINRTGTGICPVEKLCATCTTAEECLPLIAGFIAGMNGRQAPETGADTCGGGMPGDTAK